MTKMIHWISCWFKRKNEQKSLRDKTQKAVQEHWPNDPIDLEYLVRESWDVADDHKTRVYKYVVFVDKELNIDWLTADNSFDNLNSQICKAHALESIPHKHLPKDQIISFKKLIGEAIVAFFENNCAEAEELIKRAKQYVTDRTVECSRGWLLSIATTMILPVLISGIVIWFWTPSFVCTPKNAWVASCFWSICGTYLSIIRNVGKHYFDSSAGFHLHFLRVATQLLAGAILGFVAYLILKSPFFCPPCFQNFKDSNIGFCLFGFLAGFVEQFIPNIITSIQRKGEGNE